MAAGLLPTRKKTGRDDYPRLVSIETTNRCNARCVFCPNNALARDRGTMQQGLFEKIIEDCREFPLSAIEPFLQGEPFMDPEILPRIELINRRLPRTDVRLYSNGHAMTPRRIDAMCELTIGHLYISVNTLNPEKYRSIVGLELQRTLDNLDYLTRPPRSQRIAPKITFRMTRTPDTTAEEQQQFVRYCKARDVRHMISGMFNYKGDIRSDLLVPRYACEHITRVDILTSGKVTLCCMDQEGAYPWGDVTQQSVLEVYRGAAAMRYRKMHAHGQRREVEPCGTCNFFWPDLRTGGPLQVARVATQFAAYVARNRPRAQLSTRQ